ncbi:MAG: hypothetical protein M3335_06920 [Actinomycetota bacterium]|nr:hypothetical protein [Actinomycetota bacterium]
MTNSLKVESGGTTIAECTGGTFKGSIASAGGEAKAVTGSIESLTWSGCGQTTHTINKGEFEIQHLAGTDNGTFIGKGTAVTFGIFGTSCTYGFGEGVDLGTLKGGESPTLEINANVPRVAGGFICPSSTIWTATYNLEEPKPLYVEPG